MFNPFCKEPFRNTALNEEILFDCLKRPELTFQIQTPVCLKNDLRFYSVEAQKAFWGSLVKQYERMSNLISYNTFFTFRLNTLIW